MMLPRPWRFSTACTSCSSTPFVLYGTCSHRRTAILSITALLQARVRSLLNLKLVYGLYVDLTLSLAVVIFIYDALITFDREVAYLWTAKRVGGASLLFLANKWISMTVYIMLLVGFTSFPSDKVSNLIPSHGEADRTATEVRAKPPEAQINDNR